MHQGSHGHCYFSIVHAVTSQNILGSFMIFFQIENCHAVIQKMTLKHHACHVEAIFQAESLPCQFSRLPRLPRLPRLAYFATIRIMNSHKINTSKIRSRIPFANLQTYCTVDTKGCIQTGSNFGTQKTRHFWRPIRVPPRYSCSLFEKFCPPKFPFLLWLKLLVCCTIE